jgi:hypothetical protein
MITSIMLQLLPVPITTKGLFSLPCSFLVHTILMNTPTSSSVSTQLERPPTHKRPPSCSGRQRRKEGSNPTLLAVKDLRNGQIGCSHITQKVVIRGLHSSQSHAARRVDKQTYKGDRGRGDAVEFTSTVPVRRKSPVSAVAIDCHSNGTVNAVGVVDGIFIEAGRAVEV